MAKIYGFGPTGAKAATVRPPNPVDPYGRQTWFQDASPGEKNGTIISAQWLNQFIGERLALAEAAEVPLGSNTPNDNFLLEAVLSLIMRHKYSAEQIVSLLDGLLGPNWRNLTGTYTNGTWNDAPAAPAPMSMHWVPADETLYLFIKDGNGGRWIDITTALPGGGGVRHEVGPAPPANPRAGDEWFDTNTDTLFKYTTDGHQGFWYGL